MAHVTRARKNLEKAFIEGLEIAESFEMEISESMVQVDISENCFARATISSLATSAAPTREVG